VTVIGKHVSLLRGETKSRVKMNLCEIKLVMKIPTEVTIENLNSLELYLNIPLLVRRKATPPPIQIITDYSWLIRLTFVLIITV